MHRVASDLHIHLDQRHHLVPCLPTILASHGLLYFFLLLRAERLIFTVELLRVDVRPGFYPYMGTASLIIALIHFYHLVTMLYRSMNDRSLQFSSRFTPSDDLRKSRRSRTISGALAVILPSGSSYIDFGVRSLSGLAMNLWKAFDVTNPNYGVYILRELIQTGIQSQQAYMLSAHVAQGWMNHSVVFLLLLNCWSMPLIKHGLKVSSTPKSRLVCLLANLVLDFVSYFAFPMALFVPYVKDFNTNTGTYDTILSYRDMWFMQLMNEWPMVFATSIWDGFSRLLMTFSMCDPSLSCSTNRSVASQKRRQQESSRFAYPR